MVENINPEITKGVWMNQESGDFEEYIIDDGSVVIESALTGETVDIVSPELFNRDIVTQISHRAVEHPTEYLNSILDMVENDVGPTTGEIYATQYCREVTRIEEEE